MIPIYDEIANVYGKWEGVEIFIEWIFIFYWLNGHCQNLVSNYSSSGPLYVNDYICPPDVVDGWPKYCGW